MAFTTISAGNSATVNVTAGQSVTLNNSAREPYYFLSHGQNRD